jgi:hypothetical protein
MLHHAKPTRPAKEATIEVSDTPHAPFVFYEVAPAFRFTNGVVNITLSANRIWVGPNGVINEQVVVAYLRGNIQAALIACRRRSIVLCCWPPQRERVRRISCHISN